MKIIQIKNRPLRAMVSAIALLLMIPTGAAVVAAIIYGVGLVSPLTEAMAQAIIQRAPTTGDILFGGFFTLAGALIAGVIIWALYEGVKALYKGPFDP